MPDLLDVLRVAVIHDGVAKVKLEPGAKARIFRAAGHLRQRVVPQRIDAAEPDEAVRVPRHLLARPVVLGAHLLCIIRHVARRLAEDVRHRMDDGAPDPRSVERGHEIRGGDRLQRELRRRFRYQGRNGRTEQVLMMVDDRRRLRIDRSHVRGGPQPQEDVQGDRHRPT